MRRDQVQPREARQRGTTGSPAPAGSRDVRVPSSPPGSPFQPSRPAAAPPAAAETTTGRPRRYRSPRGFALALLVLLLPLLAACSAGGDPSADPTTAAPTAPPAPVAAQATPPAATPTPSGSSAAPAATPDTEPFAGQTAELGAVVWATAVDPGSQMPSVRVDRFAEDAPVLYATLPVPRIEAGATVQATWAYNGTAIEGQGATVTAPARTGGVWLAFSLTRAGGEPWPDGTYAVTVAVDGTPAIRSEVEVGASNAAPGDEDAAG